jgi:hypothetical protein
LAEVTALIVNYLFTSEPGMVSQLISLVDEQETINRIYGYNQIRSTWNFVRLACAQSLQRLVLSGQVLTQESKDCLFRQASFDPYWVGLEADDYRARAIAREILGLPKEGDYIRPGCGHGRNIENIAVIHNASLVDTYWLINLLKNHNAKTDDATVTISEA